MSEIIICIDEGQGRAGGELPAGVAMVRFLRNVDARAVLVLIEKKWLVWPARIFKSELPKPGRSDTDKPCAQSWESSDAFEGPAAVMALVGRAPGAGQGKAIFRETGEIVARRS